MSLPTLGFIGTGTLTTALVTGFCERAADKPYRIIVSPRNRDNSKMLQEKYPDRVTVAESMQDVLDQAEWIMIAILPDAGEEVLKGLQFRKEHKVINFMSDKLLPDIRSWIGDTEVLVHMVPLTYNAVFDGPIVLSPPNEEAAEIFGSIGKVVQLENRFHAAMFAAVTGYEVPIFSLLSTIIDCCVREGVPADAAFQYVTGFFKTTCDYACTLDPEGIRDKAAHSTPGGINYMVKQGLLEKDAFQAWDDALQPAIERLAANIPR